MNTSHYKSWSKISLSHQILFFKKSQKLQKNYSSHKKIKKNYSLVHICWFMFCAIIFSEKIQDSKQFFTWSYDMCMSAWYVVCLAYTCDVCLCVMCVYQDWSPISFAYSRKSNTSEWHIRRNGFYHRRT